MTRRIKPARRQRLAKPATTRLTGCPPLPPPAASGRRVTGLGARPPGAISRRAPPPSPGRAGKMAPAGSRGGGGAAAGGRVGGRGRAAPGRLSAPPASPPLRAGSATSPQGSVTTPRGWGTVAAPSGALGSRPPPCSRRGPGFGAVGCTLRERKGRPEGCHRCKSGCLRERRRSVKGKTGENSYKGQPFV